MRNQSKRSKCSTTKKTWKSIWRMTTRRSTVIPSTSGRQTNKMTMGIATWRTCPRWRVWTMIHCGSTSCKLIKSSKLLIIMQILTTQPMNYQASHRSGKSTTNLTGTNRVQTRSWIRSRATYRLRSSWWAKIGLNLHPFIKGVIGRNEKFFYIQNMCLLSIYINI